MYVDYFINCDLIRYHVLCFELSGLLDGQTVRAVTVQTNVSPALEVGLTCRCAGPLRFSWFRLPCEQHVGMSNICMAVGGM